jgi:hypothetical protein
LSFVLCSGNTIQSITEEQYYLSSRGGISISESNELPDFEREAFISLVIKDIKNQEAGEKAAQQMKGGPGRRS